MSNYIDKAWAENGDKTDIPVNAQVDGSVSYDQGFTELYERNVATDPTAIPLSRTKFNFEKNKITSNLKQWLDQCYPDYYQFDNLGNPVEYKIYSAVRYNNGVYLSKVNNNTALPTDSTKWSLFQTLDFASEAEAIARTDTNKWMNPFVSGKLIDNEFVGNIPKSAIDLSTNNLDTITTAGFYFQNSNSNTAGNNYPVNEAGSLDVKISQNGVSHTYTVSSSAVNNANKIYTRGSVSGVWSLWKDIGGATDTLNPVGSLMLFPSNNIPNGYLITDFSAVSRTGFANLFAVIGTAFGAGDGSTTFNLPPFDNDGAFLRGSGGDAAALGVFQASRLPSHKHAIAGRGNSGSNPINPGNTLDIYDGDAFVAKNTLTTLYGVTEDVLVSNYAIKICIKT
jgi:microcystin-dependent protein